MKRRPRIYYSDSQKALMWDRWQKGESLQKIAPDLAATWYYSGASTFLENRFEETLRHGERAVSLDRQYSPVYDLIGAAHTRLNQPEKAREAF